MNLHADLFTPVLHAHHDLLDQAAEDLLPVGVGRALGLPQGGDRTGQRPDPGALRFARRHRPLTPEAVVILLEPGQFPQRRLPALLQGPRHQPVLRFHGPVLPLGPFRLEPRPLQLLAPVPVHPLPFLAEVVDGLEAQLQGRRLQGMDHLPGHHAIDDFGLHSRAGVGLALLPMTHAAIGGFALRPVVDLHPPAASAADDEAARAGPGPDAARPGPWRPAGSVSDVLDSPNNDPR